MPKRILVIPIVLQSERERQFWVTQGQDMTPPSWTMIKGIQTPTHTHLHTSQTYDKENIFEGAFCGRLDSIRIILLAQPWCFLKNGPIPASFSFIFVFTTWYNYKFINALMVCLGLEPGVAGLKVQMNPLCYSGTLYLLQQCLYCKKVVLNKLKINEKWPGEKS